MFYERVLFFLLYHAGQWTIGRDLGNFVHQLSKKDTDIIDKSMENLKHENTPPNCKTLKSSLFTVLKYIPNVKVIFNYNRSIYLIFSGMYFIFVKLLSLRLCCLQLYSFFFSRLKTSDEEILRITKNDCPTQHNSSGEVNVRRVRIVNERDS